MKASLEKIACRLESTIGLDIATVGRHTLERAVKSRVTELGQGSSVESYAELAASSPQELARLIEQVVVPETWFFRDAEAYAALVDFVWQVWAPAHPGEMLRLLSAPCSSGEEPLSMAIALLESGWPAERLRIDAIDLSAVALKRARGGVYRENSFRGPVPAWRATYFEHAPGGYTAHEWLRHLVHFASGNLVEGTGLALPGDYAAIFCRNVLIYFAPEMQRKALLTLERMMAPDAILIVGAAEAFLTRTVGFVPFGRKCVSVFRSRGAVLPSCPSPEPPSPRRLAAKLRWQTSSASASEKVTSPATTHETRPTDLSSIVKLVETGRLEEARSAAEALARRPEEPPAEAFCVLGVIRENLGEAAAAEEAYRRALYLDPTHVEALGHLALLLAGRGDAAGARRLQERASRAVQSTAKS